MALETATFISDLVATNPTATDPKSQGDDHLRLLKSTIKTTFPNVTGAVTPTHTELNYVDGVTSPIQAQIDTEVAARISNDNLEIAARIANDALKANKAGDTYTGVHNFTGATITAPTKPYGSSGNDVATVDYVSNAAFNALLPAQTGNTGKLLVTDGTNASWQGSQTGNNGKFLKTNGTTLYWEYAGISTINATVTTSTTITGQYVYIPVQMSSIGQSVTLPAANTLANGGPQYIIDNTSGQFPVGIRDNSGTLISAVTAGGVGYVSLVSNSTAAGTWSVSGKGIEPGLITIDNRFSQTLPSFGTWGDFYIESTALGCSFDNNTSIHYISNTSQNGFSVFVVDNLGKVISTPVSVSTTSGERPVKTYKINSTQAICFYTDGSASKAVVLTLTGSSPSFSVSVGTFASASTTRAWVDELKGNQTTIVQMSPTLYGAVQCGTSSVLTLTAISVSGTTVTIGTSDTSLAAYTTYGATPYYLSATSFLVIYHANTSVPYATKAVVINVSGTTCTPATPATITGVGSSRQSAPCVMPLTASKFVVMDDDYAFQVKIACISVSGSTVTVGTSINLEAVDDYTSVNPTEQHMFPLSSSSFLCWWKLGSSGQSRLCVVTESSLTLTAGAILKNSFSLSTASNSQAGFVCGASPRQQSSVISDLLTVQQHGYGPSSLYEKHIVPHKISGTNIWTGVADGCMTNDLTMFSRADETKSIKVASGDYAMFEIYQTRVPVFKTNGDSITYRGAVNIPQFYNRVNPDKTMVIGNRIVFTSYTSELGSSATNIVRLINLEIAA